MRLAASVGEAPRSAPSRAGCVALAAGIHLAVFVCATAVGLAYDPERGLRVWERWDTYHYLRIASDGYGDSVEGGGALLGAFLPVYPALIRGLSYATDDPLAAALLLSFGATLLASAALYEIVARDADPREARRAVAWMNLYPTSFFLVAGYTEAVFLALVLCSLLNARRDAFLRAAALGALAGATRLAGAALLPALVVEAVLVTRERADGAWRRRFLSCVAIAPLGLCFYLAMNHWAFGDPLEFLKHQAEQWQHSPSPPWTELWTHLRGVLEEDLSAERVALRDANLLTMVALGAALVFALLRLRLSYFVYAAGAAWIATAVTWNISGPRYAIAVWPLFWGAARLGRRRAAGAVLGAASGLLLAAVAVRFMTDLWAF